MSIPKSKLFSTLVLIVLLYVFIASTNAILHHGIPRDRLKKRIPKVINRHFAPQLQKPPTFDWQQKEYLKTHNDLRQKLGMPSLQWDPHVAASAFSWAMQLKNDCNYRNHSISPYGESIYMENFRETSPAGIVKDWFSEQKLYDHKRNVCKCVPEMDGCECGHYLNIIWKSTKRVGCSGPVYCSGDKGVLVVYQYDPPGNVKGVPIECCVSCKWFSLIDARKD